MSGTFLSHLVWAFFCNPSTTPSFLVKHVTITAKNSHFGKKHFPSNLQIRYIYVIRFSTQFTSLRPGCTNDDQAWTEFKCDPDLSSDTIFIAPTQFSAERSLNSVQLWTAVSGRIKFWSEFNSAHVCIQNRPRPIVAHVHKLENSRDRPRYRAQKLKIVNINFMKDQLRTE